MQRFGQDLRLPARRLMKQLVFILIAVSTLALSAGFAQIKAITIRLGNPNEMQPRNLKTEQVTYNGRKALRVAMALEKRFQLRPLFQLHGGRAALTKKTSRDDYLAWFPFCSIQPSRTLNNNVLNSTIKFQTIISLIKRNCGLHFSLPASRQAIL
jgi:hypothetical protein